MQLNSSYNAICGDHCCRYNCVSASFAVRLMVSLDLQRQASHNLHAHNMIPACCKKPSSVSCNMQGLFREAVGSQLTNHMKHIKAVHLLLKPDFAEVVKATIGVTTACCVVLQPMCISGVFVNFLYNMTVLRLQLACRAAKFASFTITRKYSHDVRHATAYFVCLP